MRLIDADELKVNLNIKFSFGLENKFKLFNEIDNVKEFDLKTHDKEVIQNYIDKVVEELEEAKDMIALDDDSSFWYKNAIDDAIEIVCDRGIHNG